MTTSQSTGAPSPPSESPAAPAVSGSWRAMDLVVPLAFLEPAPHLAQGRELLVVDTAQQFTTIHDLAVFTAMLDTLPAVSQYNAQLQQASSSTHAKNEFELAVARAQPGETFIVERVVNAGGIPQHNATLNQIYADVLNKPVVVPDGIPTSLGSGIFAMLAAGIFTTVEEAQDKLCLKYKTYTPDPAAAAVYDQLYRHYRAHYFNFGASDAQSVNMKETFRELREIAHESHAAKEISAK